MPNYYDPLPHSLSLFFAEIPYLIVVVILFMVTEYWLVGWSDNGGDFIFFFFIYLYTSAFTYVGQWMSALMPNEKVTNVALAALVGMQFGEIQDVIAVTVNGVTTDMTVAEYIADTYDFRLNCKYNFMAGLIVIWVVLQLAI
ncbi:hypothetical protein PF005_g13673 [Phytophthora fragariae]|uniref:ABC-2 type transporter transmembrane domain-containing protein n=2 Tax=Phytophthora fragariae TaxID=53985 RepID=A0A6A3ESW3_9STRA|nr:hypothetical protein PF003_g35640 [Phytophthora fragariae]KAE8936544.1 hypothetical protein PF009_g13542 [Phytophthora fragariae]KAE9085072.1 hypothetical protein PF006_g26335 [Phytophthora fragariae]KAE9087261.1 hypothetical protein PF010_g19795 [Phytophthora fragariae]KAE9090145.1 hypothetical protein PF007_g19346 [Phytophthora fragariae]